MYLKFILYYKLLFYKILIHSEITYKDRFFVRRPCLQIFYQECLIKGLIMKKALYKLPSKKVSSIDLLIIMFANKIFPKVLT